MRKVALIICHLGIRYHEGLNLLKWHQVSVVYYVEGWSMTRWCHAVVHEIGWPWVLVCQVCSRFSAVLSCTSRPVLLRSAALRTSCRGVLSMGLGLLLWAFLTRSATLLLRACERLQEQCLTPAGFQGVILLDVVRQNSWGANCNVSSYQAEKWLSSLTMRDGSVADPRLANPADQSMR